MQFAAAIQQPHVDHCNFIRECEEENKERHKNDDNA